MHEIYRGWRRVADAYDGDRMFVAEAWVDSPERLARYVRPDELHTAFNFDVPARRLGRRRAARRSSTACLAHDRLGRRADDLGAVEPRRDPARDALRPAGLAPAAASPTRPGSGRTPRWTPRSACGGPGRRRLLMLALPGSAYVYQGEELGLPEVVDLPEDVLARTRSGSGPGTRVRGRDGCRVPIPWTADGPVVRLRHRRRRGCRSRPTGPSCRCEAQDGRRGLDPRALPRRRCGCAASCLHGEDLDAGSRRRPRRCCSERGRRRRGGRSALVNLGGPSRCRCRRTTRCCSPADRSTTARSRPTPPSGSGCPDRSRPVLRRSARTRSESVPDRSLNFPEIGRRPHRPSPVWPSVTLLRPPLGVTMTRLAEFVLPHKRSSCCSGS